MTKSVAEKMGIKEGARSILINAPGEAERAINISSLELRSKLSGVFDYIHFFAASKADLEKHFAKLKQHLKPAGMLWVSWPKGGGLGTDLSLTIIIKIGYDYGLVESKTLSVNDTWSAIKFTHPKKGKVYNNSYGSLKTD